MPDLPTAESVFGTRAVPRSRRRVQGYQAGQAEAGALRGSQAIARGSQLQAEAAIEGAQVSMDAANRLSNQINQINQLQAEREAHREKIALAKAKSYALKGLTDLETQVMQNPDYTQAEKNWNEGFGEVQAQALQILPPHLQEEFSISLTNMHTRGLAKAKQHVYDMEGKALAGSVVTTANEQMDVIAQKLSEGDMAGAVAAWSSVEDTFRSAQAMGAYAGTQDNGVSSLLSLRRDALASAFTKVPPGQRAQYLKPDENGNYKGIVKFIDEGTLQKMRETALEEEVYSVMDNNPAEALDGLNDGRYGQGLKAEKIKSLKKEAKGALDNWYEKEEANRLADDVAENMSEYQSFYNGELKMADISAIEAKKGETPFTRMAKSVLTEKRPDKTPREQASAFAELQSEFMQIAQDMSFSSKKIKEIKDFQDKAMDYGDQGLISPSEAQSFVNKFTEPLLVKVKKEQTETSGELFRESRWAPGVQDPYLYAFKSINSEIESAGYDPDEELLAKKELVMKLQEFLPEYESSGDTAADEEKIDKAVAQTIASFAKSRYPVLRKLAAQPNSYVDENGQQTPVQTGQKSDLPADSKVSVPYTIRTHSSGVRVRFYEDGTREIVEEDQVQ